VPVLALWGAKYVSISRPFAQFLSDCATNNLPHVSLVDPRFTDEEAGTSGDDIRMPTSATGRRSSISCTRP
jgi:phospholipase C